MNVYRLSLSGSFTGTATVKATSPAVAIKRLLDGGHAMGYKFATCGPNPVKLGIGQAVTVRCEHVAK